jgi:twinkle protein
MGKSEAVNELIDFIVENEQTPIGVFKLEEKPAMTFRKVAGKRHGKMFHKPDRVNLDGCDFKGDQIPLKELENYFTHDELKTGVMSLKDKVLTYDSYGATSWDQLKKAITYAVVVKGAKDIFIDPITRLTASMDSSETEVELRRFSDEISKLSKDLGFTYYCFCHLKAPTFGKPHSQGGAVVSEQFRGSRAMMESTYYLVGIERDKSPGLPEVVRNMSHFVLLEDRMFGNTAKFLVYYDTMTGKYLEPSEDILEQYYEAIGESYERKSQTQGVTEADVEDFIERTEEGAENPPWAY